MNYMLMVLNLPFLSNEVLFNRPEKNKTITYTPNMQSITRVNIFLVLSGYVVETASFLRLRTV